MKVCIITSTRADFGLLKNLIFKIKKNKNFSLKVIASGTHFSKKYGYTYDEIKENKIKIDKKIVCKFNSDLLGFFKYLPSKISTYLILVTNSLNFLGFKLAL